MEVLPGSRIKTGERFCQTDERIEKLASAVGDLIGRDGRQA